MWYGRPPTASPAPYASLFRSWSPARKPVPPPVVSGDGSAFPYVLLLSLVVQVAGRGLIVKAAPRSEEQKFEIESGAALICRVLLHETPATDSPPARL